MKTAKLGALFLVSVIALAGASAGYALWYEDLYIKGEVNTGSLDVEWSLYGTEDSEPDNKDVSKVVAEIIDDTLYVEVIDAYPCIFYYVYFDIHCTGTVPAHFTEWEWDLAGMPASAEVYIEPMDTYPPLVEAQLHTDEWWDGRLVIHLNNPGTEELSTYSFSVTLKAHQWNETP
jgi:hypothetical protein